MDGGCLSLTVYIAYGPHKCMIHKEKNLSVTLINIENYFKKPRPQAVTQECQAEHWYTGNGSLVVH